MNRASSPASSPPPGSDSSFWQLLALLAQEPDFAWLDWLLRQWASAADHAEARSRSAADVGATFLEAARAAVRPAPPSGGAAAGPAGGDPEDFPLHRNQASHHLGPWSLEELRSVERSQHPRIWKIYKAGLSRFVAFREEAGLPSAWPIPRDQVRGFLVAMDSQHLPSPKILAYLAGLSYISRMFDFPDPLQNFLVPRMVIGLHRWGDIQRKGRTPLSIEMLQRLVEAVDIVCITFYDRVLFRAAFILAWFAALRPEEMVAEDGTSVDPALLRLSDFEFLEDTIRIQLRVLEFGLERFEFRLGRGEDLCPVLAVSNYLVARPPREGPFFIHVSGEPLTKGQFSAIFNPALRLVGLLPQQFGLHSFWLGAMITAVKWGVPEEQVLRLARCPNRGHSER